MQIDEHELKNGNAEPYHMPLKMKAITGGEKGRQLWPRLVQKVAEGNTTP